MKPPNIFLCVLLAILPACSTLTVQHDDFIAPAATIATSLALDKAKPAERQKLAIKALEIAETLELFTGVETTPDEIAAAIAARAGTDPKAVALGQVIAIAYRNYSAKLGDSRSAHILNLLAEGVKAGVLPYTL